MTKYNVNQNHLTFIRYLDGASNGFYTTLLNGISSIPNNSIVTVLVKDNRFKVFPMAFSEENNEKENKKIVIFDIHIDDIEYFSVVGEKYREQIISGGGSSNINIGGAVLGGIIAGDAGMILGGQRKVKEIQTKTVVHDTRCLCVSYFSNNKRYKLFFDKDLEQYLLDNIGDLEKDIVDTKKKNKMVNKTSKKDKLAELKELYDEKLISKEEYLESRKKILGN